MQIAPDVTAIHELPLCDSKSLFVKNKINLFNPYRIIEDFYRMFDEKKVRISQIWRSDMHSWKNTDLKNGDSFENQNSTDLKENPSSVVMQHLRSQSFVALNSLCALWVSTIKT